MLNRPFAPRSRRCSGCRSGREAASTETPGSVLWSAFMLTVPTRRPVVSWATATVAVPRAHAAITTMASTLRTFMRLEFAIRLCLLLFLGEKVSSIDELYLKRMSGERKGR